MSYHYHKHPFQFSMKQDYTTFCCVAITVPHTFVDTIFNEAARAQQNYIQAPGFLKGSVPVDYIKQNFKSNLIEHTKEFLFNYCVSSFLFNQIREKKIILAGEPRLYDIQLKPHQDATFTFELSLFPQISLQDWKYFPFKAPKRKNYKDLDRQVESFIKEEKKRARDTSNLSIEVGDWVNFSIALLDQNKKPLFGQFQETMWCKIGDEEADTPLKEIFVGKKVKDTFYTNGLGLQSYFNDQLNTNYLFLITINDILYSSFFDFDQFKRYFRIKTNKEMNQKLVEVFSYRNDLSQRRSMVEQSLYLLLTKHKFDVPNHLILRQQQLVLDAIQDNPDFYVYRVQKDFDKRVKQLAEKQAKESIIIDQIAYHDNIVISDQDIKNYLNLTQRPRMKEFIYFDPPVTKVRGQERPILSEELKRTCLREKTLNYVIYHLTKT